MLLFDYFIRFDLRRGVLLKTKYYVVCTLIKIDGLNSFTFFAYLLEKGFSLSLAVQKSWFSLNLRQPDLLVDVVHDQKVCRHDRFIAMFMAVSIQSCIEDTFVFVVK